MTELKKLPNGFEYIEVNNDSCVAKIALNGAHVFEYKKKLFQDLLWVSEISDFSNDKAIRGGIPICWPSFGSSNPALPQHGFARTSMFELVFVTEIDAKTTQLLLRLVHNEKSLKLWNYKFELDLIVTLSDRLVLTLKTTNLDTKELKLTQALHTYFNVSHISDVSIEGLDKKPYFDAITNKTREQSGSISFNQEFDVIFQNVEDAIILKDKNRTIKIENSGSSSLVVWNPWIDKCSKMSAMEPEAYKEFVCLESANAYDDFKIIQKNESHTLQATFTLI